MAGLTLLLSGVVMAEGRPALAAGAVTAVSVSGNQLLDGGGLPLRLLGVNRAGTEYACIQGWGIFDGPSDATSVAAMASWHVNAVRVPLNEDCWLGINGVSVAMSGAAYRDAIRTYVTVLHSYGIVAVLDLHWTAPGNFPATGQTVMADADHAPAAWSSIAGTFAHDPGVVFDLYNEPHITTVNAQTNDPWGCWRDGCTINPGDGIGIAWRSAGMHQLLDAVRTTGARQPVLAGGLAWANDLSGWLSHAPVDPADALGADFHNYNFNSCSNSACWDSTVGEVAARVPLVTGENGENDCGHTFVDSYMSWADTHSVSYLGWAWNTSNCGGFPALITNYDGTPTVFGQGLHDHLAALAAAPAAPPITAAPPTPAATPAPTLAAAPVLVPGASPAATPAPPPLRSSLPAPVSAGFDFEDGTTEGWAVGWGGAIAARNSPAQHYSGTRSLAITLAGTGYGAVQTTTGLAGVGSGSAVAYEVYAPHGPALSVAPYAIDANWTVHFASTTALAPGWNTVTWRVPAQSGLNGIGLQVNDAAGWSGELALDDVRTGTAVAAGASTFADGRTDGWALCWGASLATSTSPPATYMGRGALGVVISGTGYPAIELRSGLSGLSSGTEVTYQVYAPQAGEISVTPFSTDSGWVSHFTTTTSLAAGWNTVTWRIPVHSGVAAIGLQVNDADGWQGQIALGSVTWTSAP